ncbi:MAG: glycosyltransferase family 2 protein [Terriglobales bacterium]
MRCDVSVVIPTYNSSGTLGRALDSIYRQSLLPREVIVVDDGSQDAEKSRIIAASSSPVLPVRFLHEEENQGPSAARNIGMAIAEGRYVAFLDSDDVWYRDKLAIQYGLMTRHNIDFSMHDYVRDTGRRTYSRDESGDSAPPALSELSFWNFVFGNPATPTVMALKEKLSAFDRSLRRCEDWQCWVESISRPGCRAVFIRRVLAGGFKPGCGMIGLSQDVEAMHASKLLVLQQLWQKGRINRWQHLAGVGIERVKYPIRILRVALRRGTALPAAAGEGAQ